MLFFISSLKLFSFFKYLSFCHDFFGYVGKRLYEKAKIIFKIYDVRRWETNNYNSSKGNVNQTMKVDQSIKYNLRKIMQQGDRFQTPFCF